MKRDISLNLNVATNVKVNRTCELELKIYYSKHYVDV